MNRVLIDSIEFAVGAVCIAGAAVAWRVSRTAGLVLGLAGIAAATHAVESLSGP